jgi:AbiV family abortive infection protein
MGKSQRHVPQYAGALSPLQVAAGINAASANAKRLADDAQLLFERNRYPSALALAALSIEESGKAAILRSIGMATADDELKKLWREYRSHKSKNALWVVVDYIRSGARKLDHFASMFDPSKDHPQVLDELKQLSLYTECVSAEKWSQPEEVVDQALAESIVGVASILAGKKAASEQELEIYFKHMRPVRNGDSAKIKRAYVNAYAEMQQQGIIPAGPNPAEELINGRIGKLSNSVSPEGTD